MDSRKDASTANKFIRTLGNGRNGVVELSIPWSEIYSITHECRLTHAALAHADSKANTKAAIAKRLPAAVQATKIAEIAPDVEVENALDPESAVRSESEKRAIEIADLVTSMNTEVDHMKLLKDRPDHPNVARLVESGKGWYNMVPVGTRTLKELTEACQDSNGAPPKALAYHFAAELGKALLYLHFGYVGGGAYLPDWRPVVHNDLHVKNIMFRELPAESQEKVGNYPSLFVLDFGHAQEFDFPGTHRAPNLKGIKMTFKRFRFEDVCKAMSSLEDLANQIEDQCLRQAVEELVAGGKDEKSRDACKALRRFVESMTDEREGCYQDLSPEWAAYFATPGLSRQEVDEVLNAVDIFG